MSNLSLVELSGSPKAMGQSFGEQFRQGIRELIESRVRRVTEFLRKRRPEAHPSREDVLACAARTVESHRQYDSRIWEEFCGIAAAAGVTVEELLIGNGYTDFRDYVLLHWPRPSPPDAPAHECSAFLVPAALAGGHPIVGQTWDMSTDALDHVVVVRRRPEDAPETLGVTTVGCLCLIGMSSEGLAVGNTNITTAARVGVNYLFTITRALQCGTAEEAAVAVESTPRLAGHDFYMADENAAFNVEASSEDCRRTRVEDEVFVHTNHCLSEAIKRRETARPEGLAGSQWRCDRLRDNFAKLDRPITMDDCWKQLSDDTRGDGAICNEDYDGVFGEFSTLATVVQCPAERKLYVCRGGAKSGRRQVLTL